MYEATRESISTHQAPDWFHDAKLGIFVHWGLYSVPGWAPQNGTPHDVVAREGWNAWFARNPYAEWYGNSIRIPDSPSAAYHAAHYAPGFTYEQFAPQFNGHEYLKRQLAWEDIAYDALDNGLLSCANPARMQEICDGLAAPLIDGLLRTWLARLPHPFTPKDRNAGYRYDVSILQAEFALTQVLDRPVTGRVLFEEVIRENLDLGRSDQVQLIFARRVTKRTPGRLVTRVMTQGIVPSLYVDDKHSRIKQYHKEGRAMDRNDDQQHP